MYTLNEVADNIYFSKDMGKEAKVFGAVAMEAQTLPDAINHEGFVNIIAKKGDDMGYESLRKVCLFILKD